VFGFVFAWPVTNISTSACAVVVTPPGSYCTMIVQLAPGFRTVVGPQVPLIVNCPGPKFLLIPGAPVIVSGPAEAPVAVLVTVTVPL
jgi:hypothetical protein